MTLSSGGLWPIHSTRLLALASQSMRFHSLEDVNALAPLDIGTWHNRDLLFGMSFLRKGRLKRLILYFPWPSVSDGGENCWIGAMPKRSLD